MCLNLRLPCTFLPVCRWESSQTAALWKCLLSTTLAAVIINWNINFNSYCQLKYQIILAPYYHKTQTYFIEPIHPLMGIALSLTDPAIPPTALWMQSRADSEREAEKLASFILITRQGAHSAIQAGRKVCFTHGWRSKEDSRILDKWASERKWSPWLFVFEDKLLFKLLYLLTSKQIGWKFLKGLQVVEASS